MNFPNIFENMIVNIKRFYQKMVKFFGNEDINVLYTVDRDILKTGRWDNVYNMQLGIVSQNIENVISGDTDGIYSIIKPAPLNMQISQIENNLDIKYLPPSIGNKIKQDKDTVKFSWEIYPTSSQSAKYRMTCNTTGTKNNDVPIFMETKDNECVPVKTLISNEYVQNDDPKYYDQPTKIGDKSFMIDLFVE